MASQGQKILDACTSGNGAALQQLFEANNIQNSDPVYRVSAFGPPSVNSMISTAITYGHVDVISPILRTYSGRKVQFTGETIEALLHHPNLDILQILYEYDPSIVSYEWDSHVDTFVTKACKQPPKKITPLLLWLIEHDADLEGGYFPQTLCNAIFGGQTLDVVAAMVNKNARVSMLAIRQAVVCQRVDVLNFFMGRGLRVKPNDAAYLRDEAEHTGSEEVINTVKRWTSDKSCVVS